MKSTIFGLLPLAGLAFAESSTCDAQRKTVTKTQYEYQTVTPTLAEKGRATPEAVTSSSCSRRTVTATKVEKVTVTVGTSNMDPGTIDVTSTSYKTIKTTVTVRPSGAPPVPSHVSSSLQWGHYPNATYHASSSASSTFFTSSSAPATPTSDLPSFSVIGQAIPTSKAAATAPQEAPETVPSNSPAAAGSKRGEATFYGGNTAGGMCSFTGYTIPAGLYGTALTDSDWDSANACGQCVSVTGPDGKTKITAMVTDQCPGCGPHHVDLYPDAFAKLADPSKGIINVSWEFVPCGITTPIVLKNKSGTSKFWFSIQVMNANVGVSKLEVSTDGGASWKATKRQPYNFFEQPSGFGTDNVDIKITSIDGKEVVVKGVSVTPNALKTAGCNF